jgi:hypothetical protein
LIELQVNERHRNETYFPIQCTGAFFFPFWPMDIFYF